MVGRGVGAGRVSIPFSLQANKWRDIKGFWRCEKNADLLGLTGVYGVLPAQGPPHKTPPKVSFLWIGENITKIY
jgi:hypothetical protein